MRSCDAWPWDRTGERAEVIARALCSFEWRRDVTKNVAGPSLRALAAAAIGRLFLQLDIGAEPPDYSMSGTRTEDINGLTLTRSNTISVEPPEIHSRLTWDITCPAWELCFIERRRLDGTSFVRSAPYQVTLVGDLVDAVQFLDIPRELFIEALRSDGWSSAQIVLEQLRWFNIPVPGEPVTLRGVMQAL